MTRELLDSKRTVLEELERSELEAQRLHQALERVRVGGSVDDSTTGSTTTGEEERRETPLPPRKSGGGLLGALSHTFQGFTDADPETTRRNSIGKTRESINEVSLVVKLIFFSTFELIFTFVFISVTCFSSTKLSKL